MNNPDSCSGGRAAALHVKPRTLMRFILVILAAVSLAPAAFAADPKPKIKPTDWDRVTKEATDLLSRYIQIDTTNPPGNEIAAARFIREKFLADGIPAVVFESQPGRGIVAARLRGIGKHSKALVLLSHMDVVPAVATEWQVPPFSGAQKDGEIWGRGALDDKGPGAIFLMAMLVIKRSGILLDSDVLFLATGDEEEGGRMGAGWVVDHQPDLIKDAGFVLNEGGGIRIEPDGRKLYDVSVSEKTPLWVRLTATGTSGHASNPPPQTAVTRLIRALNRLIDYRPPIKVLPVVQNYYRIEGQLNHGPPQYQDLAKALKDPAFTQRFLAVPSQNAMVRNTIAPTVLNASLKTNVIPASASAELDCRLLPGTDPKAMVKVLRELIADDSIKFDEILSLPAVPSRESSPLMSAIQTLAHRKDKTTVAPRMIAGFTDSHYFRQRGLVAYGFVPIEITQELGVTVHGANERVPVKSLHDGIERMVELLKIFAGPNTSPR